MSKRFQNALLTPREMTCADQAAMASGIPGIALMAAAGRAIADVIVTHWEKCPVLVACGPGNNGGDGFVVARLLKEIGWPVQVALLGSADQLKGDAAWHLSKWDGTVHPLATSLLDGSELVVDALFGAGLSREVEGLAAEFLHEVSRRQIPVCAVDVPSGVDGGTGQVRGVAVAARHTVTFFRKKPGHLLLPGRELCGRLHVADIGIPEGVLEELEPICAENAPDNWAGVLPRPGAVTHKYHRGHVLVRGGGVMTGAARLAAYAAARIGAGLVTIAVPRKAWPVYAASCLSIMVEPISQNGFQDSLADERRNVVLLGPGAGVTGSTRTDVLAAAATGRTLVLDADALSAFSDEHAQLFAALHGPCVMTPHEGEFQRLFPSYDGDKMQRARRAAAESRAVIILKGADTVIAEPNGRVAINAGDAPWLATGGTGDVLAGMVAGLCAQGMQPFEAACAAVWIHAEAGRLAGPGMLSEDLPACLPKVLRNLMSADFLPVQ